MKDARKADGTVSDAGVLRPRSMEDALERFEAVLDGRRVDAKVRPFFPVWVTRFDAFRIGVLKRSFTTCTNSDVTAFLQDQCRRFSPPLWQLKQAREAVVLFLREVIRLEAIDARLVKLTGGGEVVTGPVEDCPVGGGPGSIEEAINWWVPGWLRRGFHPGSGRILCGGCSVWRSRGAACGGGCCGRVAMRMCRANQSPPCSGSRESRKRGHNGAIHFSDIRCSAGS